MHGCMQVIVLCIVYTAFELGMGRLSLGYGFVQYCVKMITSPWLEVMDLQSCWCYADYEVLTFALEFDSYDLLIS